MHGYGEILARGLPSCRMIQMDGADHRVPTRKPVEVAAAVAAFLDQSHA